MSNNCLSKRVLLFHLDVNISLQPCATLCHLLMNTLNVGEHPACRGDNEHPVRREIMNTLYVGEKGVAWPFFAKEINLKRIVAVSHISQLSRDL